MYTIKIFFHGVERDSKKHLRTYLGCNSVCSVSDICNVPWRRVRMGGTSCVTVGKQSIAQFSIHKFNASWEAILKLNSWWSGRPLVSVNCWRTALKYLNDSEERKWKTVKDSERKKSNTMS